MVNETKLEGYKEEARERRDLSDLDFDESTDALYKIGALQKEFGLRVESLLVTTSRNILKDGKLRASFEARAEQFRATIIPPSGVINLKEELKKALK